MYRSPWSYTANAWPWILVLLGMVGAADELGSGKLGEATKSLVFLAGLAVLFATGLFWPGIVILIGITMLLSGARARAPCGSLICVAVDHRKRAVFIDNRLLSVAARRWRGCGAASLGGCLSSGRHNGDIIEIKSYQRQHRICAGLVG
jgi:hypothetical protein